MRLQQLIYPVAILALAALYIGMMDTGGYRLPRYYSPGGNIFPLGYESQASRFVDIDGKDPTTQGALFESPDPVFVTTNVGAGIMRLEPNSAWKVVYDFKFFILFSFIYIVCALWFLKSANDIHLAALCFLLAAFNFALVMMMGYHRLDLLYQISGLALTPAMINMGLRTTGKEVSGYLLIGELIAVLFLALIAYVGRENSETINNLARVTMATFFVALVFVVGLQLDNALRTTEDRVELLKRWVLTCGTGFGFLTPYGLVVLEMRGIASPIPIAYTLFAGLLFPLALIYGTYRLQIVPFQFVLTHSIVATLLTVTLVGIYGGVLLAHSLLLPEQEERYQWIVNLVFVLILVFFLDPARRAVWAFVERRVFRLDNKLTESLKHLASLLSTHVRIQPAANAFLTEVQNTLQLEKVSFLLSAPNFADFHLRRQKLLRISEKSSFWKYLTPERMIVTAYLTYAGGRREELYHYLYKNKYVLAVGILGRGDNLLRRLRVPAGPAGASSAKAAGAFDAGTAPGTLPHPGGAGPPVDPGETANLAEEPIHAALLVGYRRNGTKLELREIRYIQEAAKLAGLLIYNYALLLQEVRKRRRIRDLVIAGQVQRSITGPDSEQFPNIRMAFFNRPAISVTGDYMDLIPLSGNQFAFFLGDVSGHGLGTGYIVSSLRAIARAHLASRAGLIETVQTMNSFLMDRYRGNEYITLFAFTFNTETGEMNYINAGHPGPYLHHRDGRTTRLESNLHMVGILPTPYQSIRIRLAGGDRLYLYSDGVTETFNSAEEAFGAERLQSFLDRSRTTPVEYIPRQLEESLEEYRGHQGLHDDASFVVLEFQSRGGPLRGLFQLLGLQEGTAADTDYAEKPVSQ